MGDLAQGYRRVAGARISGVVACVPPRKVTNEHFVPAFGQYISAGEATQATAYHHDVVVLFNSFKPVVSHANTN